MDSSTQAAVIAQLLERVAALETGRRAPFTTVRGGNTRWLPNGSDSAPSVFVGPLAGESSDVGIWVTDADDELSIFIGDDGDGGRVAAYLPGGYPDRAVLDINDGIMTTPRLSASFMPITNINIDVQGRPTTTSATYETLWRAWLPCTAGGIFTQVDVYPGVGQTADVQINARVVGSGAPFQLVAEKTGMTTTDALSGAWAIPDTVLSPAASPIGQFVELVIDARRTAGAAPVAVAPYPVANWVT